MRKIKTLQDVHNYLPEGFHEICIEISGYCNAKCKYCPSGSKDTQKRGMMDADTFRHILKKLLRYKIIGSNSQIDLFWWGEPFLNQNLKEIIGVTQEFGTEIEYVLSTNASYYQKLYPEHLKNLKRFIISMPGFSQESYDKIHQFDFKEVLCNILKYAQDLKEANKLDRMWVAFHIYQFNLGEIYECYEFCRSLNISFNPGFAFPLLVEERVNYAKGSLSPERNAEMLKELVTDQLDKMIASSNRKDCVYQTRNFIIDENGRVFGCLNMRHTAENDCGSILLDNIDDIFGKIASLSACDECIECGVAPTDMSFKFFWNDWFQMMKIREYYEDNLSPDTEKIKEKGQILLLLRQYEVADDANEKIHFLEEVLRLMRSFHLTSNEIEKLIDRYAMRPQILRAEFNCFLERENTQ